MALGEKKMGNQPSAISAARATFFGPSAPRMIGMSARNGCTIGLSGLPSPVPPGIGQGVVRAVVGHRCLPGQHLAHDVDVLAGSGQRRREGLAVPALDHLGARDAEAEHEAAPGEVVHGQGRHGHGRGRAGRELAERRAQAHPLGARAPPGQRGQGVGAVGLRRPDASRSRGGRPPPPAPWRRAAGPSPSSPAASRSSCPSCAGSCSHGGAALGGTSQLVEMLFGEPPDRAEPLRQGLVVGGAGARR